MSHGSEVVEVGRTTEVKVVRSAAAEWRLLDTIRTLAVFVAIGIALWLLSDLVLLVFLAVLIAIMLRSFADWASRHTHIPHQVMLAIVSLVSVGLIMGLLYYIGPRLFAQGQDLWTQLQQQVGHLRQTYGNTPWGHAIFSELSPSVGAQNHLATFAGSVATSTLGGLASTLILVVTALYFAITPGLYIDGVVRLAPIPYRKRTREVLLDIGRTLKWWSLGQLIDMAVVGLLAGTGLLVLGVPMSLALGVLAGLFTFVPYFGAIAAAVPAMLVALTISWQTSLWVLVIFLGCHGIEGYIVSPLVQRSTVDLPPALTILGMTVLGTVFGPLGIVLGTPVAAAVLVIVREVYVGDVLGDPDAERAEDRR